jgi:hypothetical protein
MREIENGRVSTIVMLICIHINDMIRPTTHRRREKERQIKMINEVLVFTLHVFQCPHIMLLCFQHRVIARTP